MKNILMTTLLLLILPIINAQQIPNAGFENWTPKTTNSLDDFTIRNSLWGLNNVTKVADSYHGSSALKLETIEYRNGVLMIGREFDSIIYGGLPFAETPDSISGYVKYDIQPSDTAFFVVNFYDSSIIISLVIVPFTGTQSMYKRFSVPTYLSSLNPPDSISVFISSSRLGVQPSVNGSTLTIDSVTFINSSQAFPNSDFENWSTINLGETPDEWGSYAYTDFF